MFFIFDIIVVRGHVIFIIKICYIIIAFKTFLHEILGDWEENILDNSGKDYAVNIMVMGVGGGGGNAVNRMVDSDMGSVNFAALNTDSKILGSSKANIKLAIGSRATKGDGAGGNPSIGRSAAEESIDDIRKVLEGVHMLFITAGMGGGTGTGAAPVVAQVAREMGILTVGVVTKPFSFEGAVRMKQADEGIKCLRQVVDSLIVVPNENLKMLGDKKITFFNAFEAADDVLKQGVKSISELINTSGFINLDFADVKAIMKDAGYAHMAVASAKGEDKAVTAAEMAISSPLLETSISGAKGLIINITVPVNVELGEIDAATSHISSTVDKEANIIFGAVFDENLDDEIKITIIATGFDTDIKSSVSVRKTSTADVGMSANSMPSRYMPDDGMRVAPSPGKYSSFNSSGSFSEYPSDYGDIKDSGSSEETVDPKFNLDNTDAQFNDFNDIMDIFNRKNGIFDRKDEIFDK